MNDAADYKARQTWIVALFGTEEKSRGEIARLGHTFGHQPEWLFGHARWHEATRYTVEEAERVASIWNHRFGLENNTSRRAVPKPAAPLDADAMRAFRQRQGWTQERCATALAITVAQVRAIEQGRTKGSGPVRLLMSLYRPEDEPGRPTGGAD